ncbi:hypothetical protein [Pseudomonas chlororaphis]|uniref:hypothetical protein n=1 Tax=Pseudomonas chlororaphis TaxID=587753 RepID=UPI000F55B6B4|nr:hypothetical protein [Pseudomonas chlororaphis]
MQQKTVPDLAYFANDNGQLAVNESGPVIQDIIPGMPLDSVRSGYYSKGLPLRRYQPYFVDQPCYVNDTAVRTWGYADTYYYDPLTREKLVVTVLVEDLSDTLNEVLSS